MKFICDKTALYNSISIVIRAISSRTTMEILEGIYIETWGTGIKLTCYDMSIGIEILVEADVIETGTALVPGRLFCEITRKLPEGNITLNFSENKVHIDYGISSTNIQTFDPQEYPSLPEVEEGYSIIIKENKLKDLISTTLFSTALDESRPVLMGALFEIKNDIAKMVALDGYRLALAQTKLGQEYEDKSIIIPSSTLSEIQKILNDINSVNIYISASHVQFQIGNTKIISRLIEGEFIKYDKIIPHEWQSKFKINASDFRESIDRIMTFYKAESTNIVKMDVSSNKLVLSIDSEIGNINEELITFLEGKDITIAFNVKYINDILRNMKSDIEDICFCCTTNISPSIIKDINNDDYIYMALPIRLWK